MSQFDNSNGGNGNGGTAMAALAHIGAVVGAFIFAGLNFAVPIVLWLLSSDDFTKRHSKESLNFQITLFLWGIVWLVAFMAVGGTAMVGAAISGEPITMVAGGMLVFLVFLVGFVLMAFGLIMPVIAAIKALGGKDYRYPLTLHIFN